MKKQEAQTPQQAQGSCTEKTYVEKHCYSHVKEIMLYGLFYQFMVLGLTFRSLIHFGFIFYIHGVRKWSCFILLHVAA